MERVRHSRSDREFVLKALERIHHREAGAVEWADVFAVEQEYGMVVAGHVIPNQTPAIRDWIASVLEELHRLGLVERAVRETTRVAGEDIPTPTVGYKYRAKGRERISRTPLVSFLSCTGGKEPRTAPEFTLMREASMKLAELEAVVERARRSFMQRRLARMHLTGLISVTRQRRTPNVYDLTPAPRAGGEGHRLEGVPGRRAGCTGR